VKLSTLLETIEPITAIWLDAGSREQETKNGADKRHALSPVSGDNRPDLDIGSIHYRAQEVQPGGMFVAIEGQTADGHDFMHQALKQVDTQNLQVEDGWIYFLHGWSQVIAEVLQVDLTPELFKELDKAASTVRN